MLRAGVSESHCEILRTAKERLKRDGGAAPAPGQGQLLHFTEDKQNIALVEADLAWAETEHHHLVSYDSEHYPLRLKQTECPPLVLYVKGSLTALNALQIAIVGSRNASDYAKRNAYWMAKELSEAGLTVCSGMALGVDGSAHRGALESNAASTVAVVGTGIDRVYPAQHKSLCESIVAVGAVVSEFPLGTRAYAYNFPRRNRLISGLSVGVLVIEAALKSGSLITARYALEQNREVFALPNLLSNPQARGCHALIKEGAMLVDEPADILRVFGLELTAADCTERFPSRGSTSELAPLQRHLLQRLRTEDCLFDNLLDADLASFQVLNQALLDLELRGLVACRGGRYSIT